LAAPEAQRSASPEQGQSGAKKESIMWLSTVGLVATLALAFLTAPLAAEAQPRAHVPRIGWLGGTSPAVNPAVLEAFRHGLREHGWMEGQNIVIEYRWAEGRFERLPDLAAELVRLPVDILVPVASDPAIRAAQHATSTIPIVMAVSSDPVGTGFVASLARPGGNITGVSGLVPEVAGKRLQLLKDVVPHAARVAVLWNVTHPGKGLEWHETQVAAQALGVTLQSIEVRGPDDFAPAFAALTTERPDALITLAEPLTIMHRSQIADFAITRQLPMISQLKEFAEAGGLMTYGTSLPGLFRRAAYYVDRILKGAKPADLPVEQPTQFELVINHKTAQALGITIPPHLLVFADEVIQ
jgi:putative ABC transport system substrate-binding protein